MEIKLGEKVGKKRKLYVEGEFKCALYPSEIRQYELEDRADISTEEYERLMNETVLMRAKRRVLNILLKSDKTETELRRKLKENLYSDETADAVIEYVNGYHYIDELRIAQSFIRTKMYDCSEKEIRYKLQAKGISAEIAEKAYDDILEELNFKWREDRCSSDPFCANEGNSRTVDYDSEEEILNPELTAVEKYIRKKLGTGLKRNDGLTQEETSKIMASAYQKGFTSENIRKALRKILQ